MSPKKLKVKNNKYITESSESSDSETTTSCDDESSTDMEISDNAVDRLLLQNEIILKTMIEIEQKCEELERNNKELINTNKCMSKRINTLMMQNSYLVEQYDDIIYEIDTVPTNQILGRKSDKNNTIVIVKNFDDSSEDYSAIKSTDTSLYGTLIRYGQEHPNISILLEIHYAPGSNIWSQIKNKLSKDKKIKLYRNNFDLCKNYKEHHLVRDIKTIYNEIMDE